MKLHFKSTEVYPVLLLLFIDLYVVVIKCFMTKRVKAAVRFQKKSCGDFVRGRTRRDATRISVATAENGMNSVFVVCKRHRVTAVSRSYVDGDNEELSCGHFSFVRWLYNNCIRASLIELQKLDYRPVT